MISLLPQEKIACIYRVQQNLNRDAYIANEVEVRLLEHLPNAELPINRLDMLRDCTAEEIASGIFSYQDAAFNTVIAHLVPLWQEDLANFFQEVRRILAPDGVLLFSTLGKKTPHELEMLGDVLLKVGFQLPVVDRETLQLHYDNVNVLEKDLELSGLNSALVQVIINSPDDVIARFEVIYGYARGKKISTLSSGKIEIPVENITLRKMT